MSYHMHNEAYVCVPSHYAAIDTFTHWIWFLSVPKHKYCRWGHFPRRSFLSSSHYYILYFYLNHYKRVFRILDGITHTGPDCCSEKNNLFFHVSWLITLSILIFSLSIIRDIICSFFSIMIINHRVVLCSAIV